MCRRVKEKIMRIKTQFWDKEEKEFKKSVEKLILSLILIHLPILAGLIFLERWFLLIWEMIIYIFLIIVYWSYNRWKGEKGQGKLNE